MAPQEGLSTLRIEHLDPSSPSYSDTLLQILRNKTSPQRDEAALLLSKLGDVGAIELLLALVQDPHETSSAFVEALGRLGVWEAVAPLIKKLKARDERYRAKVVEALGRIGDTRAVDPLLTLIKDRSPYVAYALAVALGRLGDPRSLPLLIEMRDKETRSYRIHQRYFSVKEAVVDAIAQLQSQGQAYSERPCVAVYAIALGRLEDPNAVPILISLRNQETHSYQIHHHYGSAKDVVSETIMQLQGQAPGDTRSPSIAVSLELTHLISHPPLIKTLLTPQGPPVYESDTGVASYARWRGSGL